MAFSFAASASIDPALASLFSASAGPTQTPLKPGPSIVHNTKRALAQDNGSQASESTIPPQSPERVPKTRKRKRHREEDDDIEESHYRKLAEELTGPSLRTKANSGSEQEESESTSKSSNAPSDDEALPIPQHETEGKNATEGPGSDNDNERTVFLSNVSNTAIRSKASLKVLKKHLLRFVEELPVSTTTNAHKIESIRFRSTAYASQDLPKRAAFAKQELMDSTSTSTNAYVVYTTVEAARQAVRSLNGSICLDRHLRVDSVLNPLKPNHRNCVFVGNLNFVGKAAPVDPISEGGSEKPRKEKPAADVEEGLWRQFSKAGPVESVRVIRDPKTRVGKGFAYVQFKDANGVEAALLYDGKAFPPMLPRKLRVTRAKNLSSKPAKATSTKDGPGHQKLRVNGAQSLQHRQSRDGWRRENSNRPNSHDGKRLVFEGYRASSNSKISLKPGRKSGSSGRSKGKPKTRSSRRGTAWKAAGGKKTAKG